VRVHFERQHGVEGGRASASCTCFDSTLLRLLGMNDPKTQGERQFVFVSFT
jgi:hypothetical protein